MSVAVSVDAPLGLAQRSSGAACPHCDASIERVDVICASCGATLGEPPRRSGLTQRAVALDPAAAEAVLASSAAPAIVAPKRVVRSALDWALVVCTFGLAWFWLRRRAD